MQCGDYRHRTTCTEWSFCWQVQISPAARIIVSSLFVNHYQASIAYDNRANTSNYLGWSYACDAKGQLLSASNGATSVGFVYDALGRRTRRYVNGALVRVYHYDGWRVVEERNGANQKVYSYIYGAGGELMERVAADGAPLWYHHDARGLHRRWHHPVQHLGAGQPARHPRARVRARADEV